MNGSSQLPKSCRKETWNQSPNVCFTDYNKAYEKVILASKNKGGPQRRKCNFKTLL